MFVGNARGRNRSFRPRITKHDSESEDMTRERKEKEKEVLWTWALGRGYREAPLMAGVL